MISMDLVRREIPQYTAPGLHPLGRHVLHDPRSLAFRHRRTRRTLAHVLHERHGPVLDQGQIGSCTANAEVGAISTSPLWDALSPAQRGSLGEPLAVSMYSDEEVMDGNGPYPPNDDGSYGLTAAKVARARGYISGYTHALSLADLLDMIQGGPACIGINWYEGFDSPRSSGELVIAGQIRGGHEVVLRGYDPASRMFYGDNSWGPGWGPAGGSFEISDTTMDRLLGEDGDATQSLPLSQPAPVADPLAAFFAVAGPWAAKTRTRPDLVTLQAAILALEAAGQK
jgi:hypothetical protein